MRPAVGDPGTTTASGAAGPAPRTRPWVQLALPAALVAVGVVGVLDARSITVPTSASSVGPRAFPYAVGALLVVTGVLVAIDVLRGHRGEVDQTEDVDADRSVDWRAVLGVTASFVALVVLLEPLGWPVAGTALFTGVAMSLGARSWWRTLVVAILLALLVQVVFTRALGLYLPAGPLTGVAGLG